MSRRVNPHLWRLGLPGFEHNTRWWSHAREYSRFVMANVRASETIRRYLPEAVSWKSDFASNGQECRIQLVLPSVKNTEKGRGLNTLRKAITNQTGLKTRVDVSFPDRNALNAAVIAAEIKSQIERRRNPASTISHYVRQAEMQGHGLMIKLKGRYSASVKTQSSIQKTGRIRVQSIASPVHYGMQQIRGNYGLSCVRVFFSEKTS